jgi:hypothetical protein
MSQLLNYQHKLNISFKNQAFCQEKNGMEHFRRWTIFRGQDLFVNRIQFAFLKSHSVMKFAERLIFQPNAKRLMGSLN